MDGSQRPGLAWRFYEESQSFSEGKAVGTVIAFAATPHPAMDLGGKP